MIKNRYVLTVLIMLSGALGLKAQEVTADKIIAVLGENIILLSDVEGQYAQYISQGYAANEDVKCEILDGILTQKMLQNQAIVDSLKISESQVEDELTRRIAYFTAQIGSQEKLEQFLGKSIIEFKEDLREDIRAMILAQSMQAEITQNVFVTPSEVKDFYNKIPKDSLPYFNTEVEIAVITKKPKVSDRAKQEAKDKLEILRVRVAKGEDFATLAILYSQDGSAKSGGELGFVGRGELVKAFEAVAFKLKPGELSTIVETEFGFHIVQLIERRGEQVNVRHILIKPTTDYNDLLLTKKEMDSVYFLIKENKMTFSEAAGKFSDDDATKNNGGILQNMNDGTSKIPTDQLDPGLFFVVENMKPGEVSEPALYRTNTNEQAYRMVYYISKTDPHQANLTDDYQKIQQAALTDKQSKAMSDWFQSKRDGTYLYLSDEYKNCEQLKVWYDSVEAKKKLSKSK